METFADYLKGIENPQHRARMESVLAWVMDQIPSLAPRIAWNQPMFTDHETFIIGFSVSKKHMAVAPEGAVISLFSERIHKAGYEHTKDLMRLPWESPVDFSLLEEIIRFNMEDKKECATFWRK